MLACHLGAGTHFIDKDQRLGIEIKLALEPCPARVQDVGAVLLARITVPSTGSGQAFVVRMGDGGCQLLSGITAIGKES